MVSFECVQTRLLTRNSCDATKIRTNAGAFSQSKRVQTSENVAFWMRSNASVTLLVNAQEMRLKSENGYMGSYCISVYVNMH